MSEEVNNAGGENNVQQKEGENKGTENKEVNLQDFSKKKEENKQGGNSDELILGKFKTQEDLIKSYKELESKIGQKPDYSKLSSDELANALKEQFKGFESTSTLDGELKSISEEISKRTGIPASLTDFAASEAVSKVLGNQAVINKNETAKLMGDKDYMEQVVAGLENAGVNLDEVNDRIKKGQMTVAEMKGWHKLGERKPEGNIEDFKDKDGLTLEDALAELDQITRVSENNPFYKENHPDYLEVKKRFNYLKQRFGLQ